MLQFIEMGYLNSFLLYQDQPDYGRLLKFIIVVMPAGLLAASAYLWSSGDSEGGLVLVAEALFVSLIFWAVFPRKYQVYEDHLRIVLGGPFKVKIWFEGITAVEVASGVALTVNFVTRMTGTYVRIVKKNGPGIAITPSANELFVQNASQALARWAKSQSLVRA